MSSAVVDDLPPSYEQAIALFEKWDSLNDNDKMKHQQEIVKVLEKTTTVEKFAAECDNIGQTAVDIDNAFNRVKGGFDDILKNYIKDFPEVKDYAQQWDGFRVRWDGEDGILWSSRDLASFTASELDMYDGVFLQLVEDIETEKDLKDAQKELKNFSTREHPVKIKTDVADSFKTLRNDIEKFSKDFQKYFDDKKQKLEADAKRLQGVIKGLQDEIDTFNAQIKKILIGLGASAVLGLTGLLITGTVLAGFLIARKLKQNKLDEAQGQLEKVNRKQKALAHMQSDFDQLKPDIELVCDKLAIFAEVWASARSQAIDFANKLDGGQKVTTQAAFKLTLKLARKTCAPLAEGLRTYAKKITKSQNS